MAGRSAPYELVQYVRYLIERELAKTGMTATELANRVGISKGQVSLLRSSDRGVGWVTIMGIERALNMKPGQLQTEAYDYAKTHPAPNANPSSDKYPNRSEAARFARANRVSEHAVRTIENIELRYGNDLTPLDWFELMRDEERRQRYFGQETPVAAREMKPEPAAAPAKKSKARPAAPPRRLRA